MSSLIVPNSPQYVEIWRYGEVKGISLVFMAIDLLGGVFSDLSLVFKPKFDPFAGVAYSCVVVSFKAPLSSRPQPLVFLNLRLIILTSDRFWTLWSSSQRSF